MRFHETVSIWYIKSTHTIEFKPKKSKNSTSRYWLYVDGFFDGKYTQVDHLKTKPICYCDIEQIIKFIKKGDFSKSKMICEVTEY